MRWLALVGVLLVLVGALAWWLLGPGGATPSLEPVSATTPSDSMLQPQAAVVPVLVDTAPAVHNPTTAAELAEAVEEIRLSEEHKEAERLAAQEEVRAARALERRRAQAARAKAAKELVVDAPAPTPSAEPSPTPAPAAPLAAAAVAPPTSKSVEEICAGEANVFARDFCRVAACRQKVNAGDAICVWYRKIEAERRSRLAN